MRSLAVSVSQEQWLPMERLGEVFEDLLSCSFSEGTLFTWRQEAARTLTPTMNTLKSLLLAHKLDHVEETGARVKGLLHWLHVNSTRWLTLSHWHRQRGHKARDAIGMLPEYTGRAIPDRWSSSDHDACAQSVCGAHLFRNCLLVAERDHHLWAPERPELLVRMSQTTAQVRAAGAQRLPQAERDSLLQYFAILEQGFAFHRVHAPPVDTSVPKKPGRRTQDDAKQLLDAHLGQSRAGARFPG